jgi:hypothetical protein
MKGGDSMEKKFSFRLRNTNNQKTKRVSFSSHASPTVSDLISDLAQNINGLSDSETLRLYNKTKDKVLVEGPLKSQIKENDEIVYSSEGTAG